MKSWNEIRKAATAFSKRWKNAYDDSLLCTNETVTSGEDNFTITRTYDGFLRNEETAVVITNIRHAVKTRLYDSENRVRGYALTNSLGRGVNVTIAYDGSYLTNMVYALPNGNQFTVNLTRKASRKELVTLRDYSFGAQPVYWYSTDYDLIGRPTNAIDSVSLMREWLYNNRSELAAATIGMNLYGYSYDTMGNRLWSAANLATNTYVANALNQYTLVGRAAPSAPQTVFIYDAVGCGGFIENALPNVHREGWVHPCHFVVSGNIEMRSLVQP